MGPTKYDVLQLMEQIGGGFASNLSKAWQKADLENDRRLMMAFGHLYREYEDMVRLRLKQEVQSKG